MKIPVDAVLTGHVLVVEYLSSDGTFDFKAEFSGTGNENLSLGKTLELIEFAKAQVLAPRLAEAVAQHLDDYFCFEEIDLSPEDEDDEDYDESEDE